MVEVTLPVPRTGVKHIRIRITRARVGKGLSSFGRNSVQAIKHSPRTAGRLGRGGVKFAAKTPKMAGQGVHKIVRAGEGVASGIARPAKKVVRVTVMKLKNAGKALVE